MGKCIDQEPREVAEERQDWVSRLRAVVQRQGEVLSQVGIELNGKT